MIHIAQIDHREPAVATKIRTILELAFEQEAISMGSARLAEYDETIDEIQGSNEFFLGAMEEGELLGSLSIGPDDEPNQISISTLVVHPKHQRKGIARLLLSDALQRAQGMVVSVCTGASNLPALRLYQEFGFIEYRRGTIGPENLALVKLKTSAP
jgi:ribosomal protein S18 acetylase RimI-like enzyme